MKRKRRNGKAGASVAEVFLRGFVATALLSALQNRDAAAALPWRKVLRHGLQGGAALAAGTKAAEAAARRDYRTGAAAVLAGAAVVMAAETALQSPLIQENSLGQEEA
ncbi:hypothetical protein H261_15295 [Paramagnetospirillum caucaseum]|uniref:Uncharacterized protein n=1 Tax=Paramagnetospirillum caucaseum TaxID=1244869 RepID=M3A8A8_9PROT|nr:hypothetical protein [Paramagnetospirillum caucaseum]EME69038.1 hypothetical protein H261_15295 [Paramagnetospirillum caucaseum]